MKWSKSHDAVLHIAMLATLLILVFLSMFYILLPPSPPWHAPNAFRLFFYHIPLAWTAYLAFGVVFISSIAYLRTRKMIWDMIAGSSAEVGVLLTTLALLTGSLWNKAELGEYWRWEDAKLFTTFILWMSYIAYVALRSAMKGEARARISAAFGIISFIFVPLSYFSSRFLVSLHTDLSSYFPSQNAMTLFIGVIAFSLLYASLLRIRFTISKFSAQVEVIKDEMEESR